jgi:hypothetical protein
MGHQYVISRQGLKLHLMTAVTLDETTAQRELYLRRFLMLYLGSEIAILSQEPVL